MKKIDTYKCIYIYLMHMSLYTYIFKCVDLRSFRKIFGQHVSVFSGLKHTCSSHSKVTFTLCVRRTRISDTWIMPFWRAWVKLKMSDDFQRNWCHWQKSVLTQWMLRFYSSKVLSLFHQVSRLFSVEKW